MNLNNPVFSTVTRVNIAGQEGYGTGFFYNHNDNTYLVTNKHVVSGEDVNEVRIFFRKHGDLLNLEWADIPLDGGVGEDWYEHPANQKLDFDIDVAVIPINRTLSPFTEYINTTEETRSIETGSTAFTPDLIMSGDDLLAGGDTAMIIGYPAEFVDTNTYFPILRNGRIASPLGMPFQGKPLFITDAMMYEGTSGSPVVAGPETLKNPATGGLRTSGQGFALLGIHSETYKRPSQTGGERLNLNAAWYADNINQIISLNGLISKE